MVGGHGASTRVTILYGRSLIMLSRCGNMTSTMVWRRRKMTISMVGRCRDMASTMVGRRRYMVLGLRDLAITLVGR